jgi:hypothetical protein
MKDHCNHCTPKESSFKVGKKLKIWLTVYIFVLAVSFLPILEPLNMALLDYLQTMWWAVLLGLFIGGIIDYFVPDNVIMSYLGNKRKSSLFYAIIAGFLLSACSHGILAIAIQLYKKGAGIPSVIAFLLASPWANLPVTILLFGFFGWKALVFIAAAMIVALITGAFFIVLDNYGLIEKQSKKKTSTSYSWKNLRSFTVKKSIRGVAKGSLNLANMVLWWILIGFLMAGFIGAYVPSHIFMTYFGPTLLGLLLTLAFATILEVCSEGSAPIAFEIFKQTGALGNPFVFLMAGVATDYTEIGLLWSNIGKKTAIWLPVLTVPQIVLIGYLFNVLL